MGVTAYEVARDGVVLGTTASTSFADTAIAANRTYGYAVVALDAAGNRSAAASVSATTRDTTAPSAVTGLSGAGADGPPRVTLSWQPATDDFGIASYSVYRGGTLVTTTTATTATDTAVAAAKSYTYTVRARDAVGNLGPATAVGVAVPDTTAPSVPANLRATATSRRVSLSWSKSTDNVARQGLPHLPRRGLDRHVLVDLLQRLERGAAADVSLRGRRLRRRRQHERALGGGHRDHAQRPRPAGRGGRRGDGGVRHSPADGLRVGLDD